MAKPPKMHTWVLWSIVARRVCQCCGLVELRNERSRIAAAQPCRWWED